MVRAVARSKRTATPLHRRRLDARPDLLDFRDRLFVPTLTEVPERMMPQAFRRVGAPILDQGEEGACTGYGLATVAHYLLRRRQVDPDTTRVSPRMLYEMAKRYDEWAGERYEGSSARGAMKGWFRHGVCAERSWPSTGRGAGADRLTEARAKEAAQRPLGAYFRINHRDLVALHCALAEVGVLFASADVHDGWDEVGADGLIPYRKTGVGGHAFALIGYDQHGFWLQNSWGRDWGKGGLARVSYDDWLSNGSDVWVARLGVPVQLEQRDSAAVARSAVAMSSQPSANAALRPHVISIGNDGRLRNSGVAASSVDSVDELFECDLPRALKGRRDRRVLLYAHGGLVSEDAALQRVSDWIGPFEEREICLLAFVWKTDFWTTLKNILEDARSRRRPEQPVGGALDFLLDRSDDLLEWLARKIGGAQIWGEMKENARLASEAADGGARLVADRLAALRRDDPQLEVHLAGHSAGSIFHCYLAPLLVERGISIASCSLWAPACTLELFNRTMRPLLGKQIERFSLSTLTDRAERDDQCAGIYRKSLLYLVSEAFEASHATPLLGMEKFVRADRSLVRLLSRPKMNWILAPNDLPLGDPGAARSTSHGGFDDDPATVRGLIARIAKRKGSDRDLKLQRSASGLRELRRGWSQ